ncbi:nitroreductase family protein [Candidatus Pacearchaeota archaeon]|nr:nitroreductase family protein [Candidatus Pacearchaeota archaeon]
MKLNNIIRLRRSVRKFKNKKPNWRDILECIDVARYAPMAGNNFSLKFILVDDSEKIAQLANAAQQSFIAKAKYVVVVCTNPSRTVNSYEKRGEIYCRQQAGAAIQNFLLKIEEKGLSTCWVGAFVNNKVKEILEIPKDINIEALFPIGYEFKKPGTRKMKIDMDRILYFNRYGNKKMKSPKRIDA